MITAFLIKWWELIIIGLLVLDIIVQKTPWKGDDDILAMLKNGIKTIFSMLSPTKTFSKFMGIISFLSSG